MKALESRLKKAADEAVRKNSGGLAKTNQNGSSTKKKRQSNYDRSRKGKKGKDPRNDPEYKEKILENIAYIKELYQKAEGLFQEEQYRASAAFYAQVAMANVKKTEKLVESARKRFIEMEDLAKEHLKNADDADLARDYLREVDELAVVTREFPFTQTFRTAQRRLISLKTKPQVAGLVDYAEAEATEAGGFMLKALKAYRRIAQNPRYENTLAAMKAKRKMKMLRKNAASREQLQEELGKLADQEAPRLMAAARNFLLNNMPGRAKEKLQAVIEKFPDTRYALEAKKQLAKAP